MKQLYRVLTVISKALSMVSFVGVFVGVFFVAANVVMRYFFDSPILGEYDITQVWLCVIIVSTLAYVQTEKGHINVSMLIKVFPQKVGVGIYGVATLIGAVTCALCAYSFVKLAQRAVARNLVTMIVFIPLAPFEYFEAACMALLSVVMFIDTILCFMAIGNQEEMDKITNAWT